MKYKVQADFPLTIISTAVIFPIVFSIGHAYKRRESALDEYGALKAYGRALHLAGRDWLPEQNLKRRAHIELALRHLMRGCKDMLKGKIKDMPENEQQIYQAFSELSLYVKSLRADGLPSGECSRLNQYVSKMMTAFERLKHIYQYRTPRTLRAFSDFFIVVLPVLYGPYFASEAAAYHPALIYIMPALFAIILVGLDNIQDHLEDPFDQIGEDDIAINVDKYIELLGVGDSVAAE